MSLYLIKYILSVPLIRLPTPCAKFLISFANNIVHHYRFFLLACLVRCMHSIALPVSSYMISSAYPVGVVCAFISIFISTSNISRRLFLPDLPHGASVLLALIMVWQVSLPCR